MERVADIDLPGRSTSGSGRYDSVPSAEEWAGRAVCGNPACSRGWFSFLKDRRRPVLERQWGCSQGCLEAMARALLLRETGEDEVATEEEHRHRVPLGLILLGQGWITQEQLQHALILQRRAGTGRIGQWLVEGCGLDQGRVTRGLGLQWGCPVLPLEGFDPEAMARVLPKLLVERLGVVPVRVGGRRTLYLAFEERPDAATAFAMERMTGMTAQSGLAGQAQWRAARERLSRCEFVDAEFEHVQQAEQLPRRIASALVCMQPRASRLVRVHQFYWLRMWLEAGAMDSGEGGIPPSQEDVADRIYAVGREQ